MLFAEPRKVPGSGWVILQVEGLLGMSADDLAILKEGNPEKQQQYQALLKKVQWQDFVVRLQTRTRSGSGHVV